MKKKKLSVQIGNKLLTLNDEDTVDQQFKEEFKEAAETKPESLQEFFERLVEIQKKNSLKNRPRIIKDKE